MLRFLFLFMLALHGLIHIIGFINAWKIYPVKGFSNTTLLVLSETGVKVAGLLWLLCSILFLLASLAYGAQKEWWWALALSAVLVSQLLIVLYWQDAKAGTIANAIVLVVAVVALANWRFTAAINREVVALSQQEQKRAPEVDEVQLATLPTPVQRWLRRSGVVGKEPIQTVYLQQEGSMLLRPSQKSWIKTQAVQYITINKPAFIWSVKMDLMPLLPVSGRDMYYNGHGKMTIKLLSLVDIVNAAGAKIDKGALQRWLAEMCWYPSAALSPYIKWENISETAAKATLTDGQTSGSVTFFFTTDGDLLRTEADRYMGAGKDATLEKWSVQCKAYGNFEGVRMPVESEVTWKLKEGDFTWYKLKITDLTFNQTQRF
jgi:hypothetical protein